mmetsp:Transcript_2359/g.3304  ORF Transcript_2359/g.3304 Transcript_2359/m.3304 type:complete len:367 (-) Transcript_2359:98-1198(-)
MFNIVHHISTCSSDIETYDEEAAQEAEKMRHELRMREEAYKEARIIVPLLASRAYHLPGNNWCQDWAQFLLNNHPLFSIFCHHKLHPLRVGHRIVCLIGSIAFGLAATNFIYLYYAYHNADMNEVIFKVYLESSETLSLNQLRTYEITHGMVALWTCGGLLHSVFDISIWFISACACCLPGGLCERFGMGCGRKIGSYLVIIICSAMLSFAIFIIVLRATLQGYEKDIIEGRLESNDITNDPQLQGIDWKRLQNVDSFSFLIGYVVELGLTFFIYHPIMLTILFSGMLGCGCLPFLGGRPYELKQEMQKRLREAKRWRTDAHDEQFMNEDEDEFFIHDDNQDPRKQYREKSVRIDDSSQSLKKIKS